MDTYDYLIVGQGLAGSVLACLALLQGRRVFVINASQLPAASRAAAGLINPITGKRLNRPAMIDELLDFAFRLYPQIESLLQVSFFQKRTFLRLLQNESERLFWERRSLAPEYHPYLAKSPPFIPPGFHQRFGSLEVTRAAQIDVGKLMSGTRASLERLGAIVDEALDYESLIVNSDHVFWNGKQFRYVCFCEGYRMSANKWFNHISLNSAKGEILEVEMPAFTDWRVIQSGPWIFKNAAGLVTVGTTYSWDELDEQPTSTARASIEQRLRVFCDLDYRVRSQRAGVRPVVRADNRPIAGQHPTFPRLAILNGLGSKGALQVPMVASQLIASMEKSGYIRPEFEVCRQSIWK